MSSCLGCGGLQPEVQLLNDCYPPSKQLVAAGPDFKPLSSDLSKLTYRCTNQSSKLAKVGEELEKRVNKEAMKSSDGYPKARASLLISLAILRALVTECRRDLALFSRSIIRIVNNTLQVKVYRKGGLDLEVIGRSASCFIAYATYAESTPIGIDDGFTATYIAVLRKFSLLATTNASSPSTTSPTATLADGEKVDTETQSRLRMIGLAALHAASSSDSVFATSNQSQINAIIPPLLFNIFEAPLEELRAESAKIAVDAEPSPFFTEFSARRPTANVRRAPSLHAHIPGEKGPSSSDTLSATLQSLHALVRQCTVDQASQVIDAIFLYFDKAGWGNIEKSCWLADRLTASIQLQYRFVVPTRLIEVLSNIPDGAPSAKQTIILAMATTVLSSPISLNGLGVIDLVNNLVALIIRRVHVSPTDTLLSPLVQCITSLGTHIYYADQINDIVEELALRMGEVPTSDASRPEIIRVLIHAVIGVLDTAITADVAEARATAHLDSSGSVNKGKAPAVDTPTEHPTWSSGRRNPVAIQVWQDTLPLLCEATFSVRSAYARALILFLTKEMPKESRSKISEPAMYRFCNALHAAVYTLAISSTLGLEPPAPSSIVPTPRGGSPAISQHEALGRKNDGKGSEKGVSFNITEPTPADTPEDSTTPTRLQPRRPSRRVSLPLNRLNSSLNVGAFENVATPFDFANILEILQQLHAAVPTAALITGVPMLLALDRDTGSELVRRPGDALQGAWVLERKRSIREVVLITWDHLAEQWGVNSIVELATKALNALPEPFEVPDRPPPPPGILPPPDQPTQFYPHPHIGESSAASRPVLDPQTLVVDFASASSVQSRTSLDETMLLQRLGAKWTVDSALNQSVERWTPATPKLSGEDTHLDVASVLMSMANPSYQSFIRPQNKTIDITDLREALGSGSHANHLSQSAPGVSQGSRAGSRAASFVSTANVGSYDDLAGMRRAASPAQRRAAGLGIGGAGVDGAAGGGQSSDVQEVLRDIFKSSKGRKGGKAIAEGAGAGAADALGTGPAGASGAGSASYGSGAAGDGAGAGDGSASGPNGLTNGTVPKVVDYSHSPTAPTTAVLNGDAINVDNHTTEDGAANHVQVGSSLPSTSSAPSVPNGSAPNSLPDDSSHKVNHLSLGAVA